MHCRQEGDRREKEEEERTELLAVIRRYYAAFKPGQLSSGRPSGCTDNSMGAQNSSG